MMDLEVMTLSDAATIPTYATDGSAGMDIYASEHKTIMPGEVTLIRTDVAFAIPRGYVGLFFPRSGLSLKTHLRQPNSVGVIDSDYRGEVCGMFENTGDTPIEIKAGDRFGQMVIVACVKCNLVHAAKLDDTARGTGGFGSTGVR